MKTYYVLAMYEEYPPVPGTRESVGCWSIAFGDYSKKAVVDEKRDSYSGCKTKIIKTIDDQESIDKEIAKLNGVAQ